MSSLSLHYMSSGRIFDIFAPLQKVGGNELEFLCYLVVRLKVADIIFRVLNSM